MSAAPDEVDNPQHWLARAESSLALARLGRASREVYLEDLAFQAQQAAEKAIKALLVARAVPFAKMHDIRELLRLVESSGLPVPAAVVPAAKLTAYAVRTRYPGGPTVADEDYQLAVNIAQEVVTWARNTLTGRSIQP